MVRLTDTNEVLLTGENCFIRLSTEEGGPATTRASHWRVLFSPGGPGHALFLKSDVTDDEVRVYSDNIALARYLQDTIESLLFPEFGDPSLRVIEADFVKSGDTMTFWNERVESDEEDVSLTWYDFLEPFMINAPPGTAGRPLGVTSCFVPARRAQVALNEDMASGVPHPEKRGERDSSTACLAWSETWVRPT